MSLQLLVKGKVQLLTKCYAIFYVTGQFCPWLDNIMVISLFLGNVGSFITKSGIGIFESFFFSLLMRLNFSILCFSL